MWKYMEMGKAEGALDKRVWKASVRSLSRTWKCFAFEKQFTEEGKIFQCTEIKWFLILC